MTDERDITKPAYQFAINDSKAFAPADEFAKHKFITKDTTSLHYHAIELLQDILQWHGNDEKKDALRVEVPATTVEAVTEKLSLTCKEAENNVANLEIAWDTDLVKDH